MNISCNHKRVRPVVLTAEADCGVESVRKTVFEKPAQFPVAQKRLYLLYSLFHSLALKPAQLRRRPVSNPLYLFLHGKCRYSRAYSGTGNHTVPDESSPACHLSLPFGFRFAAQRDILFVFQADVPVLLQLPVYLYIKLSVVICHCLRTCQRDIAARCPHPVAVSVINDLKPVVPFVKQFKHRLAGTLYKCFFYNLLPVTEELYYNVA